MSRYGSVPFALLLAACFGSAARTEAPPAEIPYAGMKAIAWRCSDLDLVFMPGETPTRATIRINEETRALTMRPGPGIIEYADDQVTFSMRGETARITLPDVERICMYDAERTAIEDAALRAPAPPAGTQ